MINFPSMKTKELIKCLCRYPLCYKIIRQRGSHRTLKSEHYPVLRISYHDSFEISGFIVKKILTQEVGLTEIMAMEVIR
jgi:predicted RNA binding protein YcfA (HicA-like mRNA interferase family)